MRVKFLGNQPGFRLEFYNETNRDQWLWEDYVLQNGNISNPVDILIDTHNPNGSPILATLPGAPHVQSRLILMKPGQRELSVHFRLTTETGGIFARYAALHPLNGLGRAWEVVETSVHAMEFVQYGILK